MCCRILNSIFLCIGLLLANISFATELEELTVKAKQGDPKAQCALGVAHLTGRLAPKDIKLAFTWFSKSANQGYAEAQVYMGLMYSSDESVPVSVDLKQAFAWYYKAAIQGHSGAQNNLGLMYDNGKSVLEDDKLAVQWYAKAANQGHAEAQSNLGRMYLGGKGVLQDHSLGFAWNYKAANQGHAGSQVYLVGIGFRKWSS
jgi:TPR repeat protein